MSESDSMSDYGDDMDFNDGFEEASDDDSNQSDSANEPSPPQQKASTNIKTSRHLEELSKSLKLDQLKDKVTLKREKRKRQKERRKLKKLQEKNGSTDVRIQTLATKLNAKAAKAQPEVVSYKDPSKRKKKDSSNTNERPFKSSNIDVDEISMKQARFDVFKFGIKGLDKQEQHEARVALALKLGAKPEKKKCVPYADFKIEQKSKKEELIRQRELDRMTGMKKVSARPVSTKNAGSKNKSKDSSAKKPKKSKQNEKTPLKMGKFDGGTLRISKKEIASMKNRK